MQLRKYRWSKVYESSEEELEQLLATKHIVAERWSAEAHSVFAPHQHPLDKQLWCAEGSLKLTIDSKTISIQTGDALDLPAQTTHSAVVGFGGCVCYESPVPDGNPTILVDAAPATP